MGFVSHRMNRAASRLDWRDVAIVAIKAVHSGVFLLNATSVLHIFWVGMLNRRSRWTRVALVAALGESLVFVANRGRCPLTRLVEAMGAESGRVSDIFLPRWFADRIPLVFGPAASDRAARPGVSPRICSTTLISRLCEQAEAREPTHNGWVEPPRSVGRQLALRAMLNAKEQGAGPPAKAFSPRCLRGYRLPSFLSSRLPRGRASWCRGSTETRPPGCPRREARTW
jgi:hypothetical protein